MTLLERSTERAVKDGLEAIFFGLGLGKFIGKANHPACGVGAKIFEPTYFSPTELLSSNHQKCL